MKSHTQVSHKILLRALLLLCCLSTLALAEPSSSWKKSVWNAANGATYTFWIGKPWELDPKIQYMDLSIENGEKKLYYKGSGDRSYFRSDNRNEPLRIKRVGDMAFVTSGFESGLVLTRAGTNLGLQVPDLTKAKVSVWANAYAKFIVCHDDQFVSLVSRPTKKDKHAPDVYCQLGR